MPIRQLLLVFFDEPFKPFVIHLADGRTMRIPHPEFLVFTSSSRAIKVYDVDGSFDIVALDLVTSVRVPRAARGIPEPS